MSGSGGSCVASLILCSTISSSYSSLDPLCYDHQLTGLYLVRQLTINSLLIRQYIQSITSTQTCKISSLTEVTLTHLVNASSLRRSADVPTPFHRLATIETICNKRHCKMTVFRTKFLFWLTVHCVKKQQIRILQCRN